MGLLWRLQNLCNYKLYESDIFISEKTKVLWRSNPDPERFSGLGGKSSDRVQVRALVLGPVAGVAESLQTAGVLADVWFLSCVAPQVDLQVFQAGKCLGATLKLKKKKIYRNI